MWLQELTNNFKKRHLNKLWNLLPAITATEEGRANENALLTSEQNVLHSSNTAIVQVTSSSTAETHYHPQEQEKKAHVYETSPLYDQSSQYQHSSHTQPTEELNLEKLNINAAANSHHYDPQQQSNQYIQPNQTMSFASVVPGEQANQNNQLIDQQQQQHNFYPPTQAGFQMDVSKTISVIFAINN